MTILEQKFKQYAIEGKSIDATAALTLLTKAYISQCGVSMTNRTVIYNAAQEWQEKLAWEESPLAIEARKQCLLNLMPLLTDDYNPNVYDKYDIDGLDNDELYKYTLSILEDEEFEKETNQVLCYGVQLSLEDKTFQPYRIEKKFIDSKGQEIILSGLVYSQCLGMTGVTMLIPYQTNGVVHELITDASDLLEKMYKQYLVVLSKKDEICSLYPKYVELQKSIHLRCRNKKLTRQVFSSLFDEEIVFDLHAVIEREFGLSINYSPNEIQ